MSTLSLTPTPGFLGIPTDRATSDAGKKLSRDIAAALEAFKGRPLATGAGYQESVVRLDELILECGTPDWDGYGAKPVSPEAVEFARHMILALPVDLEPPLVAAHPDGEVALTWQGERGTDFSVSIGPSGQISYAAVFGPSVVSYGSENFSDDLPAAILDNLRRLP